MVRIVTDTASDITVSQARQMNVDLIPIRIAFGGQPYDQLADESFEEFYTLLESSKELPTTSQPSPADYLALFTETKKKKDSVVVITLSGGLSSTVQTAFLAKNMASYEDIHIIDSKQAVIGQRLLVEYALKMRDEGKSAAEIAEAVGGAVPRVRLYGALDTLKYLRKGGRIPRTTEVVGSVLDIKPLIEVKDGVIEMAGKARGHAGAVTGMIKLIGQDTNFDPAAPIYFGYTHTKQLCSNFLKIATIKYHLTAAVQYPVGGIVGTHIGPGAFAIAYLVKE